MDLRFWLEIGLAMYLLLSLFLWVPTRAPGYWIPLVVPGLLLAFALWALDELWCKLETGRPPGWGPDGLPRHLDETLGSIPRLGWFRLRD